MAVIKKPKGKGVGQKILDHFNPFSDKYAKTDTTKGSSSVEQCVKSGGTWKGGKCQMKGKGKTLLEKQVKEAGVFEGNRVPGQKYPKPT